MRRILLPILFVIITSKGYCQSLHFIKIIYEGTESKPIGTKVISVEKLIKPTDKITDNEFGHGVKTDMHTFMDIRNFIKTRNYLVTYKRKSAAEWYEIVDSNGSVYYVYAWQDYRKFFLELRSTIFEKNLDKAVIKVLYPELEGIPNTVTH